MTPREKVLVGVTAVVVLVVGASFLGINVSDLAKLGVGGGGAPRTPEVPPALQAARKLSSGIIRGKAEAALFLKENPPTEEKPAEPEVREAAVKALRGGMLDPNRAIRDDSTLAFTLWAGPDEVDDLIRMAGEAISTASTTRTAALAALARLKPAKAADTLASFLPIEGADGDTAATVLKEIGPEAEKEVVPYAFHEEQRARDRADVLLDAYKTTEATLISKALEVIRATDTADEDARPVAVKRRTQAVRWLATVQPDESRPEVNLQFLVLLRRNDPSVRDDALNALDHWLRPNDLNDLHALLRAASTPDAIRDRLIEMIGRIKSPSSVTTLMVFLRNPKTREAAGRVLETYGSLVESPLLGRLETNDDRELAEVSRILGVVGTLQQTVMALETIGSTHTNAEVRRRCQEAVPRIKARLKAGKPTG